ncbi:3941_t:CDS:2 [Funneliformis geosporum]|uniref:3941_t:CDS:1 n=1 Tax=Funneliformis geosporum TaxID=1117311 RepID=A0A9W4SKH2_9GLOM|nr:3941_t:CDS:2 [Funneliformis geosporum]
MGINLSRLKMIREIGSTTIMDSKIITTKHANSKSKEILEIKSEPRITKETQVIEHQVAEETREINLEPQIVKEDWEIKSGIQVTNDTQEILSVSQITQEVNLESQMTKSPMIEFTEKVQATTLDSKIISNQHIELITKLIDHVDTANEIHIEAFLNEICRTNRKKNVRKRGTENLIMCQNQNLESNDHYAAILK